MSSSANTTTAFVHVSETELTHLAQQILRQYQMTDAHIAAITRIIIAGQRDGCQSHGIYRLLSCVTAIKAGKVSVDALPTVHEQQGTSVVRVDANYAFSPLAFQTGLPALVEKTKQYGIAAMVINRCFHFSALWPEVEALTEQGLAALAMTPSHAWVAPSGGRSPVMGTNPIAFGYPRDNNYPFVFDFATSAIARGDLELHRRAGTSLPENSGVDAKGNISTDPVAVADGAMLPFGGHKGSALSVMVELLAGAMIGDFTSAESLVFDDGDKVIPCHGEIIIAFNPVTMSNGQLDRAQSSAENLFHAIASQEGARLPSQRRYQERMKSAKEGIRIPANLYNDIQALLMTEKV